MPIKNCIFGFTVLVSALFLTGAPAFGQKSVEKGSETSNTDSATSTDDHVDPALAPVNIQDLPPAQKLRVESSEDDDQGSRVKEERSSKGAYSRPLLFAPEDNGIEFTSPQIKWEHSGDKMNLGGLIFDSQSIRVNVSQTKRNDVRSRYREGGRSSPLVTTMSFQWPSIMSRTGRLAIVGASKKILWSTNIDEDKRSDWVAHLKSDRDKRFSKHYRDSWGIFDIDPNSSFLKNGSRFRICLTKVVTKEEKFRACSSLYAIQRKGSSIKALPINEKRKPNVYVGKESFGARASVNFSESRKIDLKVQFKSGAWVQLSSRPLSVKFLDIVSSADGESLILTGKGPKPLGKPRDLELPPNHFWSETGLLRDVIWQITISRDTPTLRVLGAWNIPFTYLIQYKDLPKEEDRIYISTRTGSGTYVDGARVRVFSPMGAKLTSREKSVERRGARNSKEFRWNFLAPEKGKNNKARITVPSLGGDTQDWVAHYQLYRGYPYEFSARLTGIVSASLETVLIGEVAAGAWFERLFGADSYYFSERRWGVNARYFRALQSFDFQGDAAALSQFSVLNADVRYNLIPGIWNRDELFGFILSTEMVDVGGLRATLGGGGAYWARTMPKVFDDIFNILPFFRYPKYVDVELVYYPMSLGGGVKPGASYNLNFHGKVFWTSRIYGEAGFGIKQFSFVHQASQSEIGVSTAYGTIGLGAIF